MKIGITEILLLILIAVLLLRPYLIRIARRISRLLRVHMERQFHMLEKISAQAWKALKMLCIGTLVFALLFLLAVSFALTHR